VAIAPTPTGSGYWLVNTAGHVQNFGDAAAITPGTPQVGQPVVDIAATPTGGGYWLLSASGQVVAAGTAKTLGSLKTAPPTGAVAMAPTLTGAGYWIVAGNGQVTNVGDAPSLGSISPAPTSPVVAMTATPTGAGYWIATANGHVYNFGDAHALGSLQTTPPAPVSGIAATPTGAGYWVLTRTGQVTPFGDAVQLGTVPAPPSVPLQAFASSPPTHLSVKLTAPAAVTVSAGFQYAVTVTNTAKRTAKTVIITQTLPTDGSFAASNPSSTPSAGKIQLALGDINPGASATATVTWTAPTKPTTLQSSAQASASDSPVATSAQTATTVQAGPVAKLILSAPAGTTAGASVPVKITAEDIYGNINSGYTGTVTFTSSDANATLPANYTFTAADAGTHSVALVLRTAGADTVTATDTQHSTVTGSAGVQVAPAALEHLALSPPSASAAAGASQSYTAQGLDRFGNSLGDLTSATTFTIAPNGTCTGAVCTATVAGAHTVTGKDGTATGTTTLTIHPAGVDHFTVGPVGGQTAGTAFTVAVTAYDQYGNIKTDYTGHPTLTGTLNLAPTGCPGPCSPTYLLDPFAGGKSAAHVTDYLAETGRTLTVTDGAATSTSQPFNITAAALDHLVLTPGSVSVTAGTAQVFAAQGFDTYGNSLGDLTTATTFTIAPDGTCTGPSCTANIPGPHTVTGKTGAATGTAILTVHPGAVTHFTFDPIGPQTAGTAFTVAVTAYDQYGNIDTDYTGHPTLTGTLGTVASSVSSCPAACPPSYTIDPFAGGKSAAHVTGYLAETGRTLTVTDGAATSTSQPFNISSGGASALTLTPATTAVIVGTPQSYKAQGSDTYGNSLGDLTSATTFTIAPDGACTGPSCTASAPGPHTVTGKDGSATGTATLVANSPPTTVGPPTLTLASATAEPSVAGSSQTLIATLLSPSGQPIPTTSLILTLAGANPQTVPGTTDSAGKATFTVKGDNPGSDTATAAAGAPLNLTSNKVSLSWVHAGAPVSTTTATGTFYPEPTTATRFLAAPGDTPAFSQTFPQIDFNPPPGVVHANQTGVGPITTPFTDVTTDAHGAIGIIPAQADGAQAGVGPLTGFDAVFRGNLLINQASDVSLSLYANAGYILGFGGQAARISGDNINPPDAGTTPFYGYPVDSAFNQPGSEASPHTVTIHFPAAGSYPYELDYFAVGGHNSLALTTGAVTPDSGDLSVYAGYADGARPGGTSFPFPWQGSSTVTNFVGGQTTPYDSGALRFDNNSDKPISLDTVSVDIGPLTYNPWPSGITVAAHSTTILTQTYSNSFDTSDSQTQIFVTTPTFHSIGKVTVTATGAVYKQPNFASIGIPYSLTFDHQGHLIALYGDPNAGVNNLGVIDPQSGAILNPHLNTSPLQNYGHIAMDPNSDNIYETETAFPGEINKISAITGQVTSINPDGFPGPTSLGFTPDGRLFVGTPSNGNQLAELDPATGHIIQVITLGNNNGLDAIAYDPTRGVLLASAPACGQLGSPYAGTCEFNIGTRQNPQLTMVGKILGPYSSMAADGQGHVYYADAYLERFTYSNSSNAVIVDNYVGPGGFGSPSQIAPLIGAGSFPVDGPPGDCTGTGYIPQVNVTRGGVTTTYADTSQVLNTKGIDTGSCGGGNESAPWTRIGGTPTTVNTVLPPAVNLDLTPPTSTATTGNATTATVTATDADGTIIAGLPLTIQVTGANPQLLSATTDTAGTARISYTGSNAGSDVLQATAFRLGMHTESNTATVNWSPQPPAPGSTAPFVAQLDPSNGPAAGGTTVTITGSNLSGATSVLFGDSPATTFTVNSDTSITAAAPPGQVQYFATSARVTVVTREGANPPTAAPTYSWLGTPPRSQGEPAISQTSPNSGPSSGTTQVTITGTGFTGATNVFFGQTPAAGFGVMTDTSITAVAPAAPSTIGNITTNITVITAGGPNTPDTAAQYTWQGSPTPPPTQPPPTTALVAVSGIDPAQGPAAGGTTLTVTGTGFTGATAVYFGDTPASSYQVLNDTTVTAVAPAAPSPSINTLTPITVVTPAGASNSGPASEYTWLACYTLPGPPATCTAADGTTTPAAQLPVIDSPSPADGSRITAPTPLTATITSPAGQTITAWSATLQSEAAGPPTTIASGTGTPPSTLGTIDPTLQQNGTYQLAISATSGNATQTLTESIIIDGALKLGHVAETFRDVSVPIGAISESVLRSYDSYDKQPHDFGIGWSQAFSSFSVHTNGPVGNGGWDRRDVSCSLGICQSVFSSSRPHNVTVTWPDGHQETFAFSPQGTNNLDTVDASAAYTPLAGTGTTSKLSPADAGDLNFYDDGNIYSALDNVAYDPTTFILSASDGTRYVLSVSDGLISKTDRNGNTVTVDRNGITSSAGPSIRFTRDTSGRIMKILEPAGQSLTYTYSPTGDLTSSTDADGNTTTYTYDTNHDLASVTGANGVPLVTMRYDMNGRLSSITNSDGTTINVSNDVGDRIETVTDPASNRITIYTYDAQGDTTKIQEVSGSTDRTTTYSYDIEGRLLTRTDPAGDSWTGIYDADGNLISQTDPTGATTRVSYSPDHQPTSITDPAGATTTFAYDANGNLVSTTDPTGATTTNTYASNGARTSTTDPSGNTTSFTSDAEGYLTSTTDANGNTTSYTPDVYGNPTSMTDANGSTTTYAYDAAGTLISSTDPVGAKTTYSHDALGNLSSVTDALGRTSSMTYNGNGQPLTSTNPAGDTTTYAYDADGRPTSTTDPLGHVTRSVYDAFGQLTSIIDPNGHTTGYAHDATGRLVSETNAAGQQTTYTYDPAGRLSSTTDPNGATTRTTYDADGRLTSVVDALHGTVSLSYDPDGRLTSTTDPDGRVTTNNYSQNGQLASTQSAATGTTTYTYDAAGNRITQTNANGETLAYTRDAAGQLTSVDGPGISQQYAYDTAGRRVMMRDSTGTTGYTYDLAGELTKTSSSQGTLSYSYDGAGQRSSMTLPGGGSVIYTRNAASQLVGLTDPAGRSFAFAYDAAGNQTQITRPNGVTSTFTYTPMNQVAGISDATDTTTDAAFSYSYDPAGNMTGETNPSGNYIYSFDSLGRLTTANGPSGKTTYSYDAAGNLTSSEGPSGAATYTYNSAGQLISDGESAYSYDPAGDLVGAGSSTFGYDPLGNLVRATVAGAVSQYGYNGDGLRATSTTNGQTTSTLWDASGQLPMPVAVGTNTIVSAGLDPLEEGEPSSVDYPLTDVRGSVSAVTAASGAVIGTQSYGPFGGIASSEGVMSVFGYGGSLADPTGLDYLRARYYDPAIERFTTPDSVVPSGSGTQGYNRYSYAADNPVTTWDPSGHETLAEEGAVAGIATGLLSIAEVGFQIILQEVRMNAAALGLALISAALIRGLARTGFGGEGSCGSDPYWNTGSGSRLGTNMDDVVGTPEGDKLLIFNPRQPGEDAHHIVAQKAAPAAYSRIKLCQAGIGIDDAENGVFLPHGEHGTHGNGYYAAVHLELFLTELGSQTVAGVPANKNAITLTLTGLRVEIGYGVLAVRLSLPPFPLPPDND
jgi:RHS repeat-associated protein